jgi:hypothetical protein
MALRTLLFLTLLLAPASAWGQAYCALRDPVRSIRDLYPHSTTYRSVVSVVSAEVRQRVNERIPAHSFHFNELGQHTLYVVFKGALPLGFVHVRSERSPSGLIEVSWALDLDLRVVDYRFQRCRSTKRASLEGRDFRDQLRGKSETWLRSMLGDGTSVDRSKLTVPEGAEELALALLRCAVKTIVVTVALWTAEVGKARLHYRVLTRFPDANGYRELAAYTKPVLARLGARGLEAASTGIDRSSVHALRVDDAEGKAVGLLIRTKWTLWTGQGAVVWWGIDAEGRLLEPRSNKTGEVQEALAELTGKALSDCDACQTGAGLAAQELLTIGQVILGLDGE